MKRLWNLTK